MKHCVDSYSAAVVCCIHVGPSYGSC